MTDQANHPHSFVGCDVGKDTIVIYDGRDGSCVTIANKAKALTAWAAKLPADCLVVCEATGGYEAELLAAVCGAGVPVHRADARKVKAFIRSFGILGKTDAIDARALAQYGAERHAQLGRWRTPDETRRKLHALVMARRDLIAERTAYGNRL
jgi:transposase